MIIQKGNHYINGNWVEGQGSPLSSHNPATGEIIWRGTNASVTEISDASLAAHLAVSSWSNLDFSIRATYLQRFAKHIEQKRTELTLLISQETGKPLWESDTEVTSVIGKAALSIQAYQERTAEAQLPNTPFSTLVRYKPHGVVAVLGPFNFPAHLSNGHIMPAILAGNTVVYKPSELTPAVATFILQCWHDIGLPAGVINGIQGDAAVAKTLLQTDLQGVFFTGSYHTGLQINQYFSNKPEIMLALEMGGNNPLLIDQGVPIDSAVYNTILSSFITSGQRCTCARRILIKDNAEGDRFIIHLIKALKELRIGSYTRVPEPFMGPVISHSHALAHLKAQHLLTELGGDVLVEMRLLSENTGFLSPGVIDMSAVQNPPDNEIFAPLVQIYRYQTFEDALTLANQTKYGLAAGLFSNDQAHFQQFYRTIRAGLINWNRPTTGASSQLPFGGVGQSGNHHPSAYFAADYCAYPIAVLEQPTLMVPEKQLPGLR